MIKLIFYKQISTPTNSIFYSLVWHNNRILGFARKHYGPHERKIISVVLNSDLNIIEYHNDFYRGEDPRCFYHNNKLYVLDNYLSDSHLIDYETKHATKIPIDGKNFGFISHNNTLYFLHKIKPLDIYSFDISTGSIKKIETVVSESNNEYRGGTPGYYKCENIYYGFGHRTYNGPEGVTHDVYYWEIDFNNTPSIKIIDIEQPQESNVICDPTSIIQINNKKYLITAESRYTWFRNQDYITNAYEIQGL